MLGLRNWIYKSHEATVDDPTRRGTTGWFVCVGGRLWDFLLPGNVLVLDLLVVFLWRKMYICMKKWTDFFGLETGRVTIVKCILQRVDTRFDHNWWLVSRGLHSRFVIMVTVGSRNCFWNRDGCRNAKVSFLRFFNFFVTRCSPRNYQILELQLGRRRKLDTFRDSRIPGSHSKN